MSAPEDLQPTVAVRPAEPPAVPVDPAQESLVSALRSSFAILRLIMLVLVVLYLVSGVFRIEPGNQGVLVRLGKLVVNNDKKSKHFGKRVFGEGWHWQALPQPFDEKIYLPGNIQTLKIDTFLFKRLGDNATNDDIASIKPTSGTLKPGVDGAMLTADKNLSHGLWSVEYQISDAEQFVQNVGESDEQFRPLLQRLFETAIVREVAYRKIEQVTRTGIESLTEAVKGRLQRELNTCGTGVELVKVNANTIVPPQVAGAFNQVIAAENEKKQQEDQARQTATQTLNQAAGPQYRELMDKIAIYGAAQLVDAAPEKLDKLRADIDAALDGAQGQVAVRLREAQAAANTTREQLGREYEEYRNYLEQYRKYPSLTRVGLWSRMWSEVVSSKDNEVFWVPADGTIEIVTNRDPHRVLEAEQGRYQKQLQGAP